ncbi:unnamed protein product, partial [Polarella glacialis]
PDGRLRGRDVSLSPGSPPSDLAAVNKSISLAGQESNEAMGFGSGVLRDGAELSGKVKMFNPGHEGKGYGFILVEGDQTDLYFQTRDLRPEDQTKVVSEGLELTGREVWFWLEVLDGGRTGKFRCHEVSLSSEGGKRPANFGDDGPSAKRARVGDAEVPAFAAPGKRLTGSVKSYNKSFGFITSEGLPSDVFFLKAELPAGSENSVSVGQGVEFELIVQDGGKLRAKGITLPSA